MSSERKTRIAMLVVPALALATAIVVAAVLSGGPDRSRRLSAAQVNHLLAGIPQHGLVLGSPRAPVTLVEFSDLQCPFCGQWARATLPVLVEKYVRPGKLRIEFRGLHSIGPDSETALRFALAAGQQNKLWHAVENLYERQGTENSGWITESLLERIASAVPAFDAKQALAARAAALVTTAMRQTDQLASAVGVHTTPTFFAGRKGGKLRFVNVVSLQPAGIEPALNHLLAAR